MKLSIILILSMLSFPVLLHAQDSDGDGIDDAMEATLGTDDNEVDSDRDGLGDGYEVANGSDPLLKDSDGGGDWDAVELSNGRNPNDPSDDVNILAGTGPVVQFVRRSNSIDNFTSAEVTLLTGSSIFRGFTWNSPMDFFSMNGNFAGGIDVGLVWGQDNVPRFVSVFSGLIHVPPGPTPNQHTFATSCNEGCRFRIHDGDQTREARHSGTFGTDTQEVTFDEAGGLYPFELLYYNDSQPSSLELSWAPGIQAFDSNVFTPIPPDSIIAPKLRGTHEVFDLNGGDIERGDTLEVVVRIKNNSTVSAFSVSMAASNSELNNRSYTLKPPGSRTTFGTILTIPIVDPGQTQEIRYTGVVPNDAPDEFTISVIFGGSTSRDGSARMRRRTDDINLNNGVEDGNEPVGLFPNSGLNEDDPTLIRIGSAVITNECNLNPCDPNAMCIDELSGFRCVCENGWTGDGVTCVNVDECNEGNDNCDENASCTDTEGSFECECAEGYIGDGSLCEDIDECTEGTDICAPEATCTNKGGSFTCECRPGFLGDGMACEDIDECMDDTDNCAGIATCTNTPGSFSCTCPAGTFGDGTECRVNNCNCSDNQVCIEDLCYDTCANDSECSDGELCFSGQCASDPCEGVSCMEGMDCKGGTCFETCTGNIDCSNRSHVCFDQLCTLSPCDGITCGSDQLCFGGSCFNACTENSDCQTGEACYDGRCAVEPCRNVTCGAGDVCYGGSCFDTCFEDKDCENGDLCYEGRCTVDACLMVSCPSEQVCHGGSCFDSCASDVDCSNPDDLCYDFRCTPEPCAGIQCSTEETCIQGHCRNVCSADQPCATGEDCEQGLCVPATVATGCACDSSDSPNSIFWIALFALFGLSRIRKKKNLPI